MQKALLRSRVQRSFSRLSFFSPAMQKAHQPKLMGLMTNSGGKCKFRTCDPCSVNAVLYP